MALAKWVNRKASLCTFLPICINMAVGPRSREANGEKGSQGGTPRKGAWRGVTLFRPAPFVSKPYLSLPETVIRMYAAYIEWEGRWSLLSQTFFSLPWQPLNPLMTETVSSTRPFFFRSCHQSGTNRFHVAGVASP